MKSKYQFLDEDEDAEVEGRFFLTLLRSCALEHVHIAC